jgi:hypothetical protein
MEGDIGEGKGTTLDNDDERKESNLKDGDRSSDRKAEMPNFQSGKCRVYWNGLEFGRGVQRPLQTEGLKEVVFDSYLLIYLYVD